MSGCVQHFHCSLPTKTCTCINCIIKWSPVSLISLKPKVPYAHHAFVLEANSRRWDTGTHIYCFDMDLSTCQRFEYDIWTDRGRTAICYQLFNTIFDTKKYVIYIADEFSTMDMIGLETLICRNRLQKSLNFFYQHSSKMKRNNKINYYFLISNLVRHKLYVKYILNDSKLWKPLFLGIFANIKNSSDVTGELWLAFVMTMKYWTNKHHKFVRSNGIMEVLIWLGFVLWNAYKDLYWIQALKKNPSLIDDIFKATKFEPTCCLKAIQRYYIGLEYFCQKRNNKQKYQKFVQSMEFMWQTLKLEDKNEDQFGYLFYDKMSQLHKHQTQSHIQGFVDYDQNVLKRCGWIHCKIKMKCCHRHKDTFKVCTGCKLMYYCCRNHQKKHWKFAHSSQCKKFRSQLN